MISPRNLDTTLAGAAAQPSTPLASKTEGATLKRTVMVVEDDEGILRALKLRLKASGFEVCFSTTAPDALGIAKENLPDIVLLDVSLPGGTGFEVAEQLKAEPTTMAAPIIFLTASLRPDFPEIAKEVGGSAFVRKPFNSKDLLEVIMSLLPQTSASA